MSDLRRSTLGRRGATALLALGIGLTGCSMLNGFLDPTKLGVFPNEYQERGIRRILTPRETPPGIPGAVEPTPEDLVPDTQEYRLGAGDVVTVLINDLIVQGIPEQAQVEVTGPGYIRIPLLGSIKVVGLSEGELEEEIRNRLIEADILPDPIVRVSVVGARRRLFIVLGAASATGPYPITRGDMRLLEALGMARDIAPDTKRLYVIRQTDAQPQLAEEPGLAPAAMPGAEAPRREDEFVIPPPTEDDFGTVGFGASAVLAQTPPDEAASLREFDELLAPQAASQPQGESAGGMPEPAFEPLVLDPETGEVQEPGWPEADRAVEPEVAPRSEYDWEDVPEVEDFQKVIEIDVRALMAGDPKQNIVIRNGDVIRVPPDVGVFYLMGEVARPGVYAFNNREITLKQAIAISGGLGPLAWPQRCEIIRREPGADRQVIIPVNLDAIFSGGQDDLYLRDDDIVNVGTSVVAPFLFVIRNSFRFTYGFGFVYDRNFADKDAYFAKQNPESLALQRRQQRGLPF